MRQSIRGRAVGLALAAALALGGSATVAATTDAGRALAPKRTAVTGLKFRTRPLQEGEVQLTEPFPLLGGAFPRPLYAATAPGDNSHVYIVGQGGTIWVVENRPDVDTSGVFLDLSARVTQTTLEAGLVGFAFDPDYAHNGYFYVFYTRNQTVPLVSVISRFQRSAADPLVADPASETELLSFPQATRIHVGGQLVFGADGKLYAGVGMGGQCCDDIYKPQDLADLHGKVLRINPDGSVPPDNPLVGQAGADARIWAWGLRNPYRFGVDRGSGVMWGGDVGQDSWEEFDIFRRGGNYGWPFYEGNTAFDNPDNRPPSDFRMPFFVYDHVDGGCAVIPGRVYRGHDIPRLNGHFIWSDYCTSQLQAMASDGKRVSYNTPLGIAAGPVAITEDARGELLVSAIFDDRIYRIEAATPLPFPQKLSRTGLFSNLASLTPAPGVVEYALSASSWSDLTRRRYWLAIPGTAPAQFAANAPWGLPLGTVLAQHFDITLADRSNRRLETRVLVRLKQGWQGYSYRWNAAQTEATLVDAPQRLSLNARDPSAPGGSRSFTYDFPGRAECINCHTAAAGSFIGLRTRQLNRGFNYGSGSENQLAHLNADGFFSTDIGDPAQYATQVNPYGTAGTLRARARSWLDANCAHCHRAGAEPFIGNLDLRLTTGNAGMNAINVAPSRGDLGVAGALLVKPGAKEQSVLWLRIKRTGSVHMPPVGTHLVDAAGVTLIGDWIDSGAP